jgi:SAM-dependent methyltransferase
VTRSLAYDTVAEFYDVWIAQMPLVTENNRRFYVREYLATEGPVVELGVGNGRIMIEAARAGKRVVGVDNSAKMLALCRQRATDAGVISRLELIEADFREFTLPEPAALVAIPYDSIGHLGSRQAIQTCVEHVYSQLAPGGRFIFDMQVFSPERFAENDRRPYLYATFRHPQTGAETLLWITIVHDLARQCRRSFVWTEEISADGTVGPKKIITIENAALMPDQLRQILARAGFSVDAAYGDFDGHPLDESSGQQIFAAHRE